MEIKISLLLVSQLPVPVQSRDSQVWSIIEPLHSCVTLTGGAVSDLFLLLLRNLEIVNRTGVRAQQRAPPKSIGGGSGKIGKDSEGKT